RAPVQARRRPPSPHGPASGTAHAGTAQTVSRVTGWPELMLDGSVDVSLLERELERARGQAEGLLAPLSEEQLVTRVSPWLSPVGWDYAHMGHFEELWLLRNLSDREPMRAEHDDVYDAFAHERNERGELPFLAPPAARAYVAAVREQVLADIAERSWDHGDGLLPGGFPIG